jgi:hypothetical protein
MVRYRDDEEYWQVGARREALKGKAMKRSAVLFVLLCLGICAWALKSDGVLVAERHPFKTYAATELASVGTSQSELGSAIDRCLEFLATTGKQSASPTDWQAYAESLRAKKTEFLAYMAAAPSRSADFAAFLKSGKKGDFATWASAHPAPSGANSVEAVLSRTTIAFARISGSAVGCAVTMHCAAAGGAGGGGAPPPFPPLLPFPPALPIFQTNDSSSYRLALQENSDPKDYNDLGDQIAIRALQRELLSQTLKLSRDPAADRSYLAFLAYLAGSRGKDISFVVMR